MLDELRGLLVFAHVVDARSFSAAAKRLNITKSAVSKHIQQLEERLGVQLLVRTTRKLSLTEVGERVYAASVGIRDSAEIAQEAASSHAGTITGTLRLTAPSMLGRKYVVPVVTEFMERHPGLRVELLFTDAFVDLVAERIDVALRGGRLVDPGLVARRLVRVPVPICASPRYLAQHGHPKTPLELAKHEWIHHLPSREPNRLTLHKGRRSVTINLEGRLTSNDGAASLQAAVSGFGIMAAPLFELSDEVRSKQLVPLLTDWRHDDVLVQAVFPPRRHVSAKVRGFVDFIAARWNKAPWALT
ncbi:MAG: LysR substrate-binding domain-containing protein [Myxococcales bacterium]